MQRCQETELRKKLEEEQKKTAKDSHWVLPGISEDSFPTVSLMEESTFDIPLGRRSFNKMNSQIEVFILYFFAIFFGRLIFYNF